MRSLHGEVLTSSPFIQGKKQKAKCLKNNFKEMVHNPNSSNSDKNDDIDCCKECQEVRNILCNKTRLRMDKMLNSLKVAA
jgi:hypothetical protein